MLIGRSRILLGHFGLPQMRVAVTDAAASAIDRSLTVT